MSGYLKPTEGLPKMGDAPRAPAKAMSSRLLTMKFMQRATASALTSTNPPTPTTSAAPNTSSSTTNTTPTTLTGMTTDTPTLVSTTPRSSSLSLSKQAKRDHLALQQALAEEEKKRLDAVRRMAEGAGDSMWELALVPGSKAGSAGAGGLGRVRVVGYAEVVAAAGEEGEGEEGEEEGEPWGVQRMQIEGRNKRIELEEREEGGVEDESDESSEDDSTPLPSTGRLTFGNFTRHKPPPPTSSPPPPDSENSDSDPDSPSVRRDTNTNPLRNATPISISGTGSGSTLTPEQIKHAKFAKKRECFQCGNMGHFIVDCPRLGEKVVVKKREREDNGEGGGGPGGRGRGKRGKRGKRGGAAFANRVEGDSGRLPGSKISGRGW